MPEVMTRILVPVDFSAHAERALSYAMSLAARFGASVELLHVVENPFISGAWNSEVYVPTLPQVLESLITNANQRLEGMKPAATGRGVQVGATVLTGHPAETIVAHARTGGFDLIVMGTHGRTGFSHVFMGSVAERVVRRAPCPVLTLRAIGEKEASAGSEAVA